MASENQGGGPPSSAVGPSEVDGGVRLARRDLDGAAQQLTRMTEYLRHARDRVHGQQRVLDLQLALAGDNRERLLDDAHQTAAAHRELATVIETAIQLHEKGDLIEDEPESGH